MKTFLLLFVFITMANISHSQLLTFTFEISEEVYGDLIQAKDKIEDLKKTSPYGYTNFSFKLAEAESDKSSFWNEVYAKFYPAPGGTKMIAKVQVDASLAFNGIDKTKSLKVSAKLNTAFKNCIWTEKDIRAGGYNENIVLDQYNKTASNDFPADNLSSLAISLEQPWAADRHNFFTEELAANNDSLMQYQEGKFHVQIKNEGDEVWKADVYPNDEPTSTYRAVEVYMKKFDFDYSKRFIFRISVKTTKGNYLWREIELEPHQLSAEIIADQYYTGAEFDSLTPPSDHSSEPEVDPIVENAQDSNKEETTNDNGTIVPESEGLTNVTDANQTQTSETPNYICTPGDTTLKAYRVYNEQICVKNSKYNMRGNVQGLLNENFIVTVNGAPIPLKGGTQIVLDESKNYIISSVVLKNTPYNQDGAEFVMKASSEIKLSNVGLSGVNIEGLGSLEFNGVSFGCRPQDGAKDFDIQFDNKGQLQEFTSTTPVKWNAKTEIEIPADSRVSMKNGKLKNISILEPTEINLNGEKFKVVPGKYASLIFNSNEHLESFTVGDNHSVEIDGQTIPIQTHSQVEVSFDGTYHVTEIIAGSEVTVTVEKKGKSKDVVVKSGEKIIVENGKIVKAG